MSTIELDTLILRNLVDLDSTAQRLNQIDENVWRAVDSVVERWAKEHGWVGRFDVEGRGLWLTPAMWQRTSEDDESPDAAFRYEVASHDPPTYFDLSDLCGLGGSRYGFRLHQKLFGKVEWKELARKHAPAFQKLGMRLDSKASPFAETVVDLAALTGAVETGDFEEALAPILEALDCLADVEKTLQSVLFKTHTVASPRKKPRTQATKKRPRKKSA